MSTKSVPGSHVSTSIPYLRTKRSNGEKTESLQLDPEERPRDLAHTTIIRYNRKVLGCHSQKPVLLHRPSCPETTISARLGTMLKDFNWDGKCIGLIPARVGYNHSLDMAVTAYLEAMVYMKTQNPSARRKSIRLYVDAIGSVKTMMSTRSFWASEEAQLAIAILSAYESTKGASLQHM